MPVEIIAEIGINHNGDAGVAEQMVHSAHAAGADTIKLQHYHTDDLLSAGVDRSVAEQCELTLTEIMYLIGVIEGLEMNCLISVFDIEALRNIHALEMDRVKIPSGELNNLPLLAEAAESGMEIILSTGMSTLQEVRDAVDYLGATAPTIMHCTSAYPAPCHSLNLRTIKVLRKQYERVGYSDHSYGFMAAIAAVTLGVCCIEKHYTLDRSMVGPDHAASASPTEFAQMVRYLRQVESMLGSYEKVVTDVEFEPRKLARKSVVSARTLKAGQTISAEDLTTKRPGTGIPADEYYATIGRKLARDVEANQVLREEDLCHM